MPHRDHEKNRAAWNQMVDLHVRHPEYCTEVVLKGGTSLRWIELRALGDVRGKRLLHLMCQFGLDTLSWAREGAIVTGVDISDVSIARAKELKQQAGLDAKFVRCDVLDLVGVLDERFDIVFQSYGTHIWLGDLAQWARVIAHYLKPGGRFFLIDEHPINVLFLFDPTADYFAAEPQRTIDSTDYCERDTVIKGEMVEWQHPVSLILNALIDAGLEIRHVGEYNFGYYRVTSEWIERPDRYCEPPGGQARFPVMLSIDAVKRP